MNKKIGDFTWAWYEDDDDFWIVSGLIAGFDGEDVIIHTDCWIDLEPNEVGPYAMETKAKIDNLCDTKDEALNEVSYRYRMRVKEAFDSWELQNKAAKREAQRLHPAPEVPFKYKAGDEIFVVIPYASGMIVELHRGKVVATPQSANPRWFSFEDDKTKDQYMAPANFVAKTAEQAIDLYVGAKRQTILNEWIRKDASSNKTDM